MTLSDIRYILVRNKTSELSYNKFYSYEVNVPYNFYTNRFLAMCDILSEFEYDASYLYKVEFGSIFYDPPYKNERCSGSELHYTDELVKCILSLMEMHIGFITNILSDIKKDEWLVMESYCINNDSFHFIPDLVSYLMSKGLSIACIVKVCNDNIDINNLINLIDASSKFNISDKELIEHYNNIVRLNSLGHKYKFIFQSIREVEDYIP